MKNNNNNPSKTIGFVPWLVINGDYDAGDEWLTTDILRILVVYNRKLFVAKISFGSLVWYLYWKLAESINSVSGNYLQLVLLERA